MVNIRTIRMYLQHVQKKNSVSDFSYKNLNIIVRNIDKVQVNNL